jgi:hypothetical protein
MEAIGSSERRFLQEPHGFMSQKTAFVMEATNLKTSPEATDAAVESQELRQEKVNVDTVGSLKDRYADQRLDTLCRRQAKKRPQGNGGSRKTLPYASAVLAVRKG